MHLGPHHVQVTVLRCKHLVISCFFVLFCFSLRFNQFVYICLLFHKEISECIYWVINLDFPNLIQLGGRRPGVTIALPGLCGFVIFVYMCICVSVCVCVCQC